MPISMPQDIAEQKKVGDFFSTLELAITLHQREPPKEDKILNELNNDTLFYEYYCHWLVIYKEGSVRDVTMQKYHLTAEWIKKLIPNVKLRDFDRITYQQLINDYAESHERQTTMDFHHQLKGAILDAVDDGLIVRDPTRKVIIKGKSPNTKKKKYLSRYELQKLLADLDLNSGLNMDWLILLIAKTGMRFSEAIAVTPVDFDFAHQILSVNKTWDYKGEGGFQPTKNKSSIRKIRLDWQTVGQFYAIVREMIDTDPIFVSKEKKIYNSTLNDVLERHCKAVGIPTISVHGLRHTHASLLLFDGVSIASVAQRLGHSSINTTQKTYLHIIRELENKDIDLIMKSISSLLD
jgi:integrase